MPEIPVIDLSKCGLLVEDEAAVSEETLKSIGKQLNDVLSTSGFAYLSNHGIEMSKVDEVNAAAALFFALPSEEKRKFYTHDMEFAFDPIGATKADMKHVDYQEAVRVSGAVLQDDSIPFPDVPNMRESSVALSESCKLLMWRLLKALGFGMKLKDPEYFSKAHALMNRKGNMTQFKMVHYPPALTDDCLDENRLRLGEHTDWTTLIILFQDDIGGLQRKAENGEFVDVPPIPGTIVLNIGDALQKWSGGRLKATVHRVVPALDPEKRKRIRRSIVYFGCADNDVLMEPLQFEDGENVAVKSDEKILTVQQYLAKRFDEVFY